MQDYLPNNEVEDLIHYVDEINLQHGATTVITDPTTDKIKEIERKGLGAGLKLLRAKVRHLGTEQNLMILQSIFEELKPNIDMVYKTKVDDIIIDNNTIKGVIINNEPILAKKVVVVPGRDGSKWLTDICHKHNIHMSNNQVDIGVRVETYDEIMSEINEHLYEGKFIFQTSVGTTVRTFCSNPSGHVVIENHSGTMLANGHAYKDPKLGSKNTNFALLVSHVFDEPFNEPNEFAHAVSSLANKLSLGSIIVQTYGDIIKGRRTTPKRLKEGFINPTLKEAVPGDLGLVLPYNTMKSLIEMIQALDVVTPGIATEHTLFYGVEAKFYSARPKLSDTFETEVSGLYAGGDGAGLTRGLAQAGASGIHMARDIIKNI
ncbi:MAG: NAD(P)/FAD-dependent oxidoreductase [Lachnospirales bacterium]